MPRWQFDCIMSRYTEVLRQFRTFTYKQVIKNRVRAQTHHTGKKKSRYKEGVPCQSGNPQPLQVTIHFLQETLHTWHPGQVINDVNLWLIYSLLPAVIGSKLNVQGDGCLGGGVAIVWHHCKWHLRDKQRKWSWESLHLHCCTAALSNVQNNSVGGSLRNTVVNHDYG